MPMRPAAHGISSTGEQPRRATFYRKEPDFELEQDKAASKLLDEMIGEGEYARLLGKFLKVLLGYIK